MRLLGVLAATLLFLAVATADAQVQQATSYRFAGGPVTTFAANPSDWIVLTGSTARPVYITNIFISAVAPVGTQATIDVSIVTRGTPDIGGTSSTLPAAYMSGSNLPAGATVNVYSANPTTLGGLTGVIDRQKLNIGPLGNAGYISLDYGNRPPSGPIYIAGGQQLAINLTGEALPPGTSLDWRIEESETP